MEVFSHKVRVRVCGILAGENGILLLKHEGIGAKGFIWSPPGGGVEFGESLEDCLMKEFKEETGLDVEVKEYLFTNEYIDTKHHAVELFFKVKRKGGELKLGTDPELAIDKQILSEIRYLGNEEIKKMEADHLHNVFRFCDPPTSILQLKGLFKFRNN